MPQGRLGMSKGKVKTKLKDPLQGTAISRKFHHQIPNSFATRSKNPKAKPNWGICPPGCNLSESHIHMPCSQKTERQPSWIDTQRNIPGSLIRCRPAAKMPCTSIGAAAGQRVPHCNTSAKFVSISVGKLAVQESALWGPGASHIAQSFVSRLQAGHSA